MNKLKRFIIGIALLIVTTTPAYAFLRGGIGGALTGGIGGSGGGIGDMLKSVYDSTDTDLDLRFVVNQLSTGVLELPTIVIDGGDPTLVDIGTGTCVFADSFTDPLNPTFSGEINFGPFDDVTPAFLTSTGTAATFFSVTSTGALVWSDALPTASERRVRCLVAEAIHIGNTVVESVVQITDSPAIDSLLATVDLGTALGVFALPSSDEFKFSSSGSTLGLSRASGTAHFPGFNYQNDPTDYSKITRAAESGVTWANFWQDGSGGCSAVISQTLLDADAWDDGTGGTGTPNGTVDDWQYQIFRIFYSPDNNQQVLQYGQALYPDKAAANHAVTSEDFFTCPILEGLLYRGGIVVKGDATAGDGGDLDKIEFVTSDMFGQTSIGPVRLLDGVTNTYNLGNSTSTPPYDFAVFASGATVVATVERTGSGNIVVQFGGNNTEVNTTPAAVITLDVGTDAAPTFNCVYVPESTKVITVGTGTNIFDCFNQIGENHAKIGVAKVQSLASVQAYGPFGEWEWDNSMGDGEGMISTMTTKHRYSAASKQEGMVLTPTVGVDQYDVSVTSGEALQLRSHTTPARDSTTDGLWIVNDSVTPGNRVLTLTGSLLDSAGVSMATKSYSLVFIQMITQNEANSKIFVNLPSCSYTVPANAVADINVCTDYSLPDADDLGTAIVLARVTVTHSAAGGGTWTELDTELFPAGAGGGTPASGSTFTDNIFRLLNVSDTTKKLALNLANITTATTRTWTVADKDGTVALTSDLASYLPLAGGTLTGTLTGTNIFLTEQSASGASTATYGQLWVQDATPNELWFTDDTGTDFQLGAGGGELTYGDVITGTIGNGISINDTSAQATGTVKGIKIGNDNYNSNSNISWIPLDILNNQNVGGGENTGIRIVNKSTDFNVGDLNNNGAGQAIIQLGINGVAQHLYGYANVSTINGLSNATIDNTQSSPSIVYKGDAGTSAQAHTVFDATCAGASTTQYCYKANLGTGYGGGLAIESSKIAGLGTALLDVKNTATAEDFRFRIGYNGDVINIIRNGSNMGTNIDTLFSYNQQATGSTSENWKSFDIVSGNNSSTVNQTNNIFNFHHDRRQAGTTDSDDDYSMLYVKDEREVANASANVTSSGSTATFEMVSTETLGTIDDSRDSIRILHAPDSTGDIIKAYSGSGVVSKMNRYGSISFPGFTADPCGDTSTFGTGSTLYNLTSDYPCICNGIAVARRLESASTSCF